MLSPPSAAKNLTIDSAAFAGSEYSVRTRLLTFLALFGQEDVERLADCEKLVLGSDGCPFALGNGLPKVLIVPEPFADFDGVGRIDRVPELKPVWGCLIGWLNPWAFDAKLVGGGGAELANRS